jgi:hypothetical protein
VKIVESEFACKRCGETVRFRFRKPNAIGVTCANAFCESCGTDYELAIKFQRGTNLKGLDVEMKYVLPKPKTEVATA